MTIAAIAQATAAAVFALVILSLVAPQTAAAVALIVCPLFIAHTLYTAVRDLMTAMKSRQMVDFMAFIVK